MSTRRRRSPRPGDRRRRRAVRGPAWEARPRWRVARGGDIAVGPGKADLLEAIAARGSISSAAAALGMSYRRAWTLVATMNQAFRRPLVATSARRRAGAALTDSGRRVLALYRRIEARSLAAARRDLLALRRLLGGPRG
jgi:molybdate transport system regulatory protein